MTIVKFKLEHKECGKYVGDVDMKTYIMNIRFVPSKEGITGFDYDLNTLKRCLNIFKNDTVCIRKNRMTLKINCGVA